MKRFLPLILAALLGCDPSDHPNGIVGVNSEWTLVDKTPTGLGIYKKRNEKEGVTIYATSNGSAWSISVVKDK